MASINANLDYSTIEETIKNYLTDTIGRKTISIGKHKPKESSTIKDLRKEKKETIQQCMQKQQQ